MRTAGVRRYAAGIVPDSPAALTSFLREELSNIEGMLNALAESQHDLTTVQPAKPRDGMVRYAQAGVLGASQGFYGYYAGSWKYLG